MANTTVQTRRWTRHEYDRMVELGLLRPDERVELLEGEIITVTPQNSPHSASIGLAHEALLRVFGADYWIRIQLPLVIDPDSEPEPDLAVVKGTPRDYVKAHPHTAVLVVEVADTSLSLDRERKLPMYARAGIPEYWIINLTERCLEVYRDPIVSSDQLACYNVSLRFVSADSVSPFAQPDRSIRVVDLLP
ncbi:MAG: Uma2 family endonuclease [Nitrospiraceae bacterium]